MNKPNPYGVYEPESREELARHDRSYAAVKIARCEDDLYRYGLDLMYSYGGFAFPVTDDDEGYATYSEAKDAGTKKLLARFPVAWASKPQSVPDELREIRAQIEQKFLQPSLF